MKTTYRFAWISTIATYVVIFTGGLVRVSGAGLGCPDWPKCFGRWLPPFNASQLPPSVDPSQFNYTLAWIEYINRLCGLTLGILIAITAILVIINFTKVARVLIPAIIAGLLVAFLGWQGGRVVTSELEPTIVSLHALLSLVLVSLMIYITQQIHYILYPDAEKDRIYPSGISMWLALAWGLSLAQVLVGTQVRGAIEVVRGLMPFVNAKVWLSSIGALLYIHTFLGILVIAAGVYVGLAIIMRSQNPSSLMWEGSWAVILLMFLDILLGFGFLLTGTPPIMEILHLWVSSFVIGVLLMMYSAAKRQGRVAA